LAALFPVLFPGAGPRLSFLGIAGKRTFLVIFASWSGQKNLSPRLGEKRFPMPPDGSILIPFSPSLVSTVHGFPTRFSV
jgi:hypothetical protein